MIDVDVTRWLLVCNRDISDVDPDGCETGAGQRYCLSHLTPDADPELYNAYMAYYRKE